MAQNKIVAGRRPGERGQTIILVAVSIVSLLAMAALAVDVVTLYVAKGQIQHAADAAALAGAKAFVESAVTSVPASDPSFPTLKTIASNTASSYIAGAVTQNLVSGSSASVNVTTFDFTSPGNPRITVGLQRTGLPIFFARIWSSTLASVSATATAEAYNPWNSQTQTGALIPVAPRCVKPILVSNTVSTLSTPFIKITDGTIEPSSSGTKNTGGLIGQEVILSYGAGACTAPPGKQCIRYKPQLVSGPHNFCSSCAGASQYEQSIACCDGTVYDFSQCGESATAANFDPADPSGGTGPTQTATQCLIHASAGQDVLDIDDFLTKNDPIQIQAGGYSQSKLGVAASAPISTSDSIVTLPIYDTPGGILRIVGFFQVFVNSTGPANGDLDVTILNVAGCGPSPATVPAISGGGATSIPVRLITPP